MRPPKYLILIIMLTVLLHGCSMLPVRNGADVEPQTLRHWQIQGKLAVRHADDSVSGYLTWEQNRDRFDLFITGPFGQGATRLSGDSHRASLQLPEWPQPRYADSPEELMETALGWQFPARNLTYWIQGLAGPDSEATTSVDHYGLLESLTQDGWTIRYSRYQRNGEHWLPGLLKISGHDYQLTLAINQWTLHD